MKKALAMLLAVSCLFLGGCSLFRGEKNLKKEAAQRLCLSLNSAVVLEEWDTHGGFHGDGESFIKLSCEDGFEEKLGSAWKALPLQGDAYQYFYEWGGVFEHPNSGEKVIPEVANGYWYFKDTGAMNWEFAIFDCAENILYFYVWDA